VWIEARVSEFDLHRLGSGLSGVVTLESSPGKRIEVGVGASALKLLPTLDAESRTAVLRCELPNPDGSLRAGMLASLELATEQVDAKVSIPVEAIVIDQGLPTAFVMLEGETFQKRDLDLGVKDGEYIEIVKGIAAGEHVATRGAYVIKLAALSPASFGAGHQH
jgi:membrane fusion protein, heavy metal efflux system